MALVFEFLARVFSSALGLLWRQSRQRTGPSTRRRNIDGLSEISQTVTFFGLLVGSVAILLTAWLNRTPGKPASWQELAVVFGAPFIVAIVGVEVIGWLVSTWRQRRH